MTAASVSPVNLSPPSLPLDETQHPTRKAADMARMKAPTSRKKSFGDQRLIRIEKTSLPLVIGVAVIAALISFVALKWVGDQMGMVLPNGWSYAWLLPLAIDGFGIICALGIVSSHGTGQTAVKRFSEWVGLGISLGLSMAGNVVHSLHFVDGTLPPRWLVMAYSIAIPGIVAYALHLLGRASVDSILAKIHVDDPDHIQVDPEQAPAPPARAVKPAPRPAPARTEAREAVAEARTTAPRPTAPTVAAPTAPVDASPEDVVFEQYAGAKRAGEQWTGKQIADRLGYSEGAGRKIRKRWDLLLGELDAVVPATDRAAADLDRARADRERATA